jgi:NADH-quinone oxidoreductase subunit I
VVAKIISNFYYHIRAILTGLKYLFSPGIRITLKYPDELLLLPENYRGMLKLNNDLCISCGLCSQVCPAGALSLKLFEYEQTKQVKRHPEVDYKRCIFCGFCVDICPSKALELTRIHDAAFYVRDELYYEVDRLIAGPKIDLPCKKSKYVVSEIDEVKGLVYRNV